MITGLNNTLMVLEDYDAIRCLLERTCSENGYSIISTGNLTDALEVVREYHPRVIIFDVDMKAVKDPLRAMAQLVAELPNSNIIAIDAKAIVKEQQLLSSGAAAVVHQSPLYVGFEQGITALLHNIIAGRQIN